MLNLVRVSEFLSCHPHGFLIFNCNIIEKNVLTGAVRFRNSNPVQWELSEVTRADSAIPEWAFVINGEFGRPMVNYDDIIKAVNEYMRVMKVYAQGFQRPDTSSVSQQLVTLSNDLCHATWPTFKDEHHRGALTFEVTLVSPNHKTPSAIKGIACWSLADSVKASAADASIEYRIRLGKDSQNENCLQMYLELLGEGGACAVSSCGDVVQLLAKYFEQKHATIRSMVPKDVYDRMFQIGRDLVRAGWRLAGNRTLTFTHWENVPSKSAIQGEANVYVFNVLGATQMQVPEIIGYMIHIKADMRLYLGDAVVATASDVVRVLAASIGATYIEDAAEAEDDVVPYPPEKTKLDKLREAFVTEPIWDPEAEAFAVNARVAIMEEHMGRVVDMGGLSDDQQAAYKEAFHEGWLAKEAQVQTIFKSIVGDAKPEATSKQTEPVPTPSQLVDILTSDTGRSLISQDANKHVYSGTLITKAGLMATAEVLKQVYPNADIAVTANNDYGLIIELIVDTTKNETEDK